MSRAAPPLLALIVIAAPASAAGLVELDRWEGKAALSPNRGPGEEDYRLEAEVRWSREAPGDAGGYAVRVTLPGGQARTQPLDPGEGPGGRRLTVLVPVNAVRNLRPEQLVVRAVVVQQPGGTPVSNELDARIADFPTPDVGGSTADPGPFGWGRPLSGPPGQARPLPRPGPQGLMFVRISATASEPGFFIATTEATVSQVSALWKGYDPRAGRSDEFALEDPGQPAIGLTPRQANEYLAALRKADPSGLPYRLPTEAEWLRAAQAGRGSAFWWGDQPTYPQGANFLGPEPALATDATAPSRPSGRGPGFRPNPWGLFHTFGNAAEWATSGPGRFVRLGGHFRTEPASPLPAVAVEGDSTAGPDPYVGVRPALSLSSSEGAALARRALAGSPVLAQLAATYDPDRSVVTVTGAVPEPSLRREADRRLGSLWFVAAVENRVSTPTIPPGGLALLGPVLGQPRRLAPLGRPLDEWTVGVRWSPVQPVDGSEWWVNVYQPGGGHFAHLLAERRPGPTHRLAVLVDRTKIPAGPPLSVALSLGAPAPSPDDPRVVSNVYTLAR
jgi:hypothetical protein